MTPRERILIADDDQGLHKMLDVALSPHGFHVMHAYDGRRTLEIAKSEIPELIMLDVIMPFVDGRDVCMELKTDPATRDIKVLMMTGKGDKLDRMLGFDIGADDYIAKPFTGWQLFQRIRIILDNEQST
jgi:DNA-binding response OmpR family regulator